MNKPILLLFSLAASVPAEPAPLAFDQVLALARRNAPRLRAAQHHVAAAEQSVAASGLWANPELAFFAEGLGGDLDPYRDGEYTLSIRQAFPLGGRRGKERDLARKGVEQALAAAREGELALEVEVWQAFYGVLALQEIGAVRAEQEVLARASAEAARHRFGAGVGSELDVVQAELALEETLLAQACQRSDLAAARIRLASLLGVEELRMARLSGAYYELPAPGNLEVAAAHPALRGKAAEAETLRAQARLLRSADTPDLALEAGYRREEAIGADSFVFGVSLPLDLARKGRAGEAAALRRAAMAEEERAEIRRRLEEDLATALVRYRDACTEAETTRTRLLPKAEQAYGLSRAGYEAGRFPLRETIAAQQHLAAIRVRHMEALRDAHLARTNLYPFTPEGIQP